MSLAREVAARVSPTLTSDSTVVVDDTTGSIAVRHISSLSPVASSPSSPSSPSICIRWLSCIALASSCAAGGVVEACATAPTRSTLDAPAPGVTVVVKHGDTLSGIALAYGTSAEEIAAVNGLSEAAVLHVGQPLFLPLPTPRGSRGRLPTPSRIPPPNAEGTIPGGVMPEEPLPDDAIPERRAPSSSSSPPSLSWPVDGVILRDFTRRGSLPYDGLLIAAPAGTPVTAAADGEVLFAGDQGTAYGLLVILSHAGELVTVYAHLSHIDVVKGAHVSRGDVVGAVGQTGRQDAPRLHFQARRGRTPVDPIPLLPP